MKYSTIYSFFSKMADYQEAVVVCATTSNPPSYRYVSSSTHYIFLSGYNRESEISETSISLLLDGDPKEYLMNFKTADIHRHGKERKIFSIPTGSYKTTAIEVEGQFYPYPFTFDLPMLKKDGYYGTRSRYHVKLVMDGKTWISNEIIIRLPPPPRKRFEKQNRDILNFFTPLSLPPPRIRTIQIVNQ